MEDTRIKLLAIMGKAGSGKDTILNKIISKKLIPNAVPIISCTTRPKRDYEEDGKDYHFLSREEFTQAIFNEEMLEAQEFNTWIYGTRKKDLNPNKINIGVYTPSGIYDLATTPEIDLCVFYILATDKTRMLRQLNREKDPDVHEIVRRFSADEWDFELEHNIKPIIQACPYFFTIDNENKKVKDVAIAIAATAGQYWLKK